MEASHRWGPDSRLPSHPHRLRGGASAVLDARDGASGNTSIGCDWLTTSPTAGVAGRSGHQRGGTPRDLPSGLRIAGVRQRRPGRGVLRGGGWNHAGGSGSSAGALLFGHPAARRGSDRQCPRPDPTRPAILTSWPHRSRLAAPQLSFHRTAGDGPVDTPGPLAIRNALELSACRREPFWDTALQGANSASPSPRSRRLTVCACKPSDRRTGSSLGWILHPGPGRRTQCPEAHSDGA